MTALAGCQEVSGSELWNHFAGFDYAIRDARPAGQHRNQTR